MGKYGNMYVLILFLNTIDMSKEEIINKSENEWRNELTPEEYQICRMKGTELLLLENTGILKIMEFINVFVVV